MFPFEKKPQQPVVIPEAPIAPDAVALQHEQAGQAAGGLIVRIVTTPGGREVPLIVNPDPHPDIAQGPLSSKIRQQFEL